jgi:hypothetical protein
MVQAYNDGPKYPFSAYGIPYTVIRVEPSKYTVGVRKNSTVVEEIVSFDLSTTDNLTRTQEVYKVVDMFRPHMIVSEWPNLS